MNQGLKIALSLFLTILLFTLYLLFFSTNLFMVIETQFFNQNLRNDYLKRTTVVAEEIKSYHEKNLELYKSILANPFIISAYVSDQRKSSEDILKRSEKFELLKNNTPDFLFIRLLGDQGKTIHYSTREADIKSQSNREIVYYNYDQLDEEIPARDLIASQTSEAFVFIDGLNQRFIYCYPMIDEYDIYKGTGLVYINYKELQRYLVNENDISLAQNLVLVDNSGVVLNLPFTVKNDLIPLIQELWKQHSSTNAYVDVLENAQDDDSDSSFLLFNIKEKNYGIVSILLKQTLFRLGDSIKLLINIILLITIYLIFFFLFNFKEDSVLIVSRRIKRFQIELLNTFIEADMEVNWKKWKREMVAREAEIKKELKKGIGRVNKTKKELVDNLIDKSWDEILTILEKKAAKSTINDNAIGQIQNLLAKALKNGNFVLPVQQSDRSSPVNPSDNVSLDNEASEIDEIEPLEAESESEVEEIARLDEVSELEASTPEDEESNELAEIDVEEIDESESVQLYANDLNPEDDDLEEVEEIEEIEEIEEVQDNQGITDAGYELTESEPESLAAETTENEIREIPEAEDLIEVGLAGDVEAAQESSGSLEDLHLEPFDEVAEAEEIEPEEKKSQAEAEELVDSEEASEIEALDKVSESEDLNEVQGQENAGELKDDTEDHDEDLEVIGEVEELEAEDDEAIDDSEVLDDLEEVEDFEDVEELEELDESAQKTAPTLKKAALIEEVEAEEEELLEELEDLDSDEEPELLEEFTDDESIAISEKQSSQLQELFDDVNQDLQEASSFTEPAEELAPIEETSEQTNKADAVEELESVMDEESMYFFEKAGKYYLIKNSQKHLFLKKDKQKQGNKLVDQLQKYPQVLHDYQQKIIAIYPLKEVLEIKKDDFQAIVEEKGMFKVAKNAGSHSQAKVNNQFKSLVDSVETKTSGPVITEAVDDEKIYRPFQRQKKLIQINMSAKGIDLDGFIKALGNPEDELVITKSLIQLSRDMASICVAILSFDGQQFKPVYSVGFSNRDHENLVFDTDEECYQAVFAQKHILVLNQSPAKTPLFKNKFSEMDMKYVESGVFLPIIYNQKASYLFFSFITNEPVDVFKLFEKLHIKF